MPKQRFTSRVVDALLPQEPRLRAFIRRFFSAPHIVDDICQETILRALEAERSRQVRAPKAFLFGIARNVMREQLDKESRSLIDFVDDFSPDDFRSEQVGLEETLDGRARMLRFFESVSRLPRQCQRVFVMKKVYGYSHKEIATALNISVSTVEKHVAAGLKRCMDDLQKINGMAPDITLLPGNEGQTMPTAGGDAGTR